MLFIASIYFRSHLGMLLSVPFLLVTFFVYACIPELRNMHGKSLMCYVLGLAVGYTVLSLVQMAIFEGKSMPCKFLGYMVYFWFMVSFFWLNVMSFDIYWTFKCVSFEMFAIFHCSNMVYSLQGSPWCQEYRAKKVCPVLVVCLGLSTASDINCSNHRQHRAASHEL